MRDRTVILGGLVLCLGSLTWPAWRTLAVPPASAPALARPANATECVAPTGYMRASHMVLLDEWREAVVRGGARTYTTPGGRTVAMSLTGTCIRACHTDKAAFCDRCHDYAQVKPTCWNCHVWDGRQLAADSRQPLTRDAGSMAPVEFRTGNPLPAARYPLSADGGAR